MFVNLDPSETGVEKILITFSRTSSTVNGEFIDHRLVTKCQIFDISPGDMNLISEGYAILNPIDDASGFVGRKKALQRAMELTLDYDSRRRVWEEYRKTWD